MHMWLYESIKLNVYHVKTAYEEKQMPEKLQGGYTCTVSYFERAFGSVNVDHKWNEREY